MLIHKASKSLVFNLRDPSKIIDVIPTSRIIEHDGHKLVQVKHGITETIALRGLGFDAPSPIDYYYKFPKIKGEFDPFDHQKDAVKFMAEHKRCFNLSEPRTGKTYSILMTYDYLKQNKIVDKMIVYSTLSTISTVWADSIFDTFPEYNFVVVKGDFKTKQALLASDADIFIMNHDSVKTLEKEIKLRKDIGLVAWDEADNLTNGQSAMWKSFNSTLNQTQYVILATATPTGEKVTDAWALGRIINPNKTTKYFTAFKRATMVQISPFRWLPLPTANQTVFETLQPSFCVRKKDVMDLPEVTHERRECELTLEQQRMFKEMKKDMATEHAKGDLTAVNAADKLLKLLQILLGVYKKPDGSYQELDCKPRIDTILECIKGAKKKTIIFLPFTGALRHYHRIIKKHYSCEYVDGSVSSSERDRLFRAFQKEKHPQVLIAHPKTCAHGLELSSADTIIWGGPTFSGRQFTQANERNNSTQQDSEMKVYYIGASPIEWKAFDNLLHKKANQSSVLDLYKSVIDG